MAGTRNPHHLQHLYRDEIVGNMIIVKVQLDTP